MCLRIILPDRTHDPLELAACLLQSDTGFKTSIGPEITPGILTRLLIVRGKRYPNTGPTDVTRINNRSHYSDDGVVCAFHAKSFTDDVLIAAELTLPQVITNND